MLEDKEIGHILHKAARMNKNSFTNKINGFGLTPGQYTVIKEIYYHEKNTTDLGLSPACIAERLEIDRPTISGIIDRLMEQKWIVRILNPEDKRSCIICVTDKTRDNLKEVEKIQEENQQLMLMGFTEEDQMLFTNYLERVIDNFKSVEKL